MPESKLEFRIKRDSNGADVSPDNVTVDAAKCFSKILLSIYELIEASGGADRPNIKIVNRSLGLLLQDEFLVGRIESNILEVSSNKSNSKKAVDAVNGIRKLLVSNAAEFDFSFTDAFGKTTSVLERVAKSRDFILNDGISYDWKLFFITGKLNSAGGTKPNLNIKTENGTVIVSCTESNAKKATPYLYQQVFLSYWGKAEPGKKEKIFCDVYINSDVMSDLSYHLHQYNEETDEIIKLKKLHYSCRHFLDKGDYDQLRRFIRLFNHESHDINALNIILIITASFNEDFGFWRERQKIEMLFNSKMESYLTQNI